MSSFCSLEFSKVFHTASFGDAEDFKESVESLSKQIFGENSLFMSSNPDDSDRLQGYLDGFALDLTNPKRPQLFLTLNHLSKVSSPAELGEAILKCVSAFEDNRAQIEGHILGLLHESGDSKETLGRVYDRSKFLTSSELIRFVLSCPPKVLVATDRSDEDLFKVISKINANISVLEVRPFLDGEEKRYFMFDSLYDQIDDYSSLNDGSQDLIDERKKRIERRATCDTLVVAISDKDFTNVFMKEHRWFPVDIGAGMKDRVQYIAAYLKEDAQAITHIAKIKDIRYFKSTGRYEVLFDGEAWEIGPIVPEKIPQDVIYVRTVFGDDD